MNTIKCEDIINQHKKEIDSFTNTNFLQNLKLDYNDFISQEYFFMDGIMRFVGIVLSNAPPFAFSSLSKAIFRLNEFNDFLKEKLKQKNINIAKMEQKSTTKEYLSYLKSHYNQNFKEQITCLCMMFCLFNMVISKEELPNELKEISSFLKNIQFDQICEELKRNSDLAFSIEDKGDYQKNILNKLISLEHDSWKMCTITKNQ